MKAQQRLNVSNFVADKVALDIIEGMIEAKRTGIAQYLTNRKGHRWLRVAVMVDDHGRRYFQFISKWGQECGHMIRRCALTHWNLYVLRQFERLETLIIRVGDERLYTGQKVRHIIAANEASPLMQSRYIGQHNANTTEVHA